MIRASSQPPRRYEPRGKYLAIDPRAFADLFFVAESRDNEMIGSVAVVDICGPLEQHASGWCDSYEAITQRVQAACDDNEAGTIVLRVDSPGGDVDGCFDAVRKIREQCELAKKPLLAYVDGKACSAGYALASAASYIAISDSALVGSIGVLATRADFSAQNAARGIRIALITSGARKADGNPDQPLTNDELDDTQQIVDSMADVFFALVQDMRGIPAEQLRGLQARVFHGDSAIRARLANKIESFEQLLANIASIGGTNMAAKSSYEEARAKLEEAAKGDDANAAAAKRALAAMDEVLDAGDDDDESEESTEDEDDESKKKKDTDESAEGDDEKPSAEDDKPKESARASNELSALAEVHKLRAELAAKDESDERKRLLASRKDFAPEMLKALQKAPLKVVRNFVKTMPRAPIPKAKPTASSEVTGTRGESQGGSDPEPIAAVSEIDRRMGLTQTTLGVHRSAHALVIGVVEKPIDRSALPGGKPSNSAGGAA